MTTRETPRILVAFVVLTTAYDVATAISGQRHGLSTYLTGIAMAIYLLSMGLFIKSEFLTQRMSPALFASAVVVTIVALNFKYALEPDINTLGIMIICLAACGPLILLWLPFLIAMVLMSAITTYTVLAFTPFHLVDWVITVLVAVGMSTMLLAGRRASATRLAVATVTIEAMATRDPLTGVLNRHGLDVASGTLVGLAERVSQPVFAAFVDVVGLKKVNDTFGHQAGDLVIQRTARAVESNARGSDIVVRWGGDEFLILGIGPQPDPRSYATRIMLALDLTGLEGSWDGRVSVGTASSIHPDIDALVNAADKAMYDGRSHPSQGIAPATPVVRRQDPERPFRSRDADDAATRQAPWIGQEQGPDVCAVEPALGGP